MKRYILYSLILAATLVGCAGEAPLTPQVETKPEYAAQLAENASRSQVDATIYEWYKKYNTAFLYDFTEEDFSWLWAGKYNTKYTPFVRTDAADMQALEEMLQAFQEGFLDAYSEKLLRSNLPYKVFFVKELLGGTTRNPNITASTNGQDAIIVGWLDKRGNGYSSTAMGTEVGNVFGGFFYDKLPYKPQKFIDSRVDVKFRLVTFPKDPAIEEEQKVKPDFENKDHAANVCGYVKGYLPTHVRQPTEAQDFADFLFFIKGTPGSEIRKVTQFYWRVAMRAQILIDFYKTVMNEDLIASQNETFPDDKVTAEDFKFSH